MSSIFDKKDFRSTDTAELQRKAHQAKLLLADPVFLEGFERMEYKTLQLWLSSGHPDEREKAWAMCQALKELKREFQIMVNDGVVADAIIARSRP